MYSRFIKDVQVGAFLRYSGYARSEEYPGQGLVPMSTSVALNLVL